MSDERIVEFDAARFVRLVLANEDRVVRQGVPQGDASQAFSTLAREALEHGQDVGAAAVLLLKIAATKRCMWEAVRALLSIPKVARTAGLILLHSQEDPN